MENWHEQILIRAEIEALNLIKEQLEIIQASTSFGQELDFIFAKLNAEKEAEQKVNRDTQFCIDNDLPNYSNETVQWLVENTSLDYNTYLKKLNNISSLWEKVELTKSEQFLNEITLSLAEHYLKNK